MSDRRFTRRGFFRASAAASVRMAVSPALGAPYLTPPRGFNIAACDWSIGRAGRASALELAKQLGLEGVQVKFGLPGEDDDLRLPEVRERYAAASREHGVAVASLAMVLLSSQPLATHPDAERHVSDCIDAMAKMKQRLVLLAFFGAGDLNGKRDLQEKVAARLKRLASKAEKAGVTLGIESWLNAEDHMRIVDAVASPAVKVYYDVANMTTRGYDIHNEIRFLGKKHAICEFHCKENGFLLGKGKVDFPKVRDGIGEIGYEGWLVIEGAVPEGMAMEEAYKRNAAYVRSLFPRRGDPKAPNVLGRYEF